MSKSEICNNFDADINTALNAWITNRVIPYSNAYSAALRNYNDALEERNRDLERHRELLLIVVSVLSVAAIEFAPVAAAITASSRTLQGAVLLRVANVVGRSRFITRHDAFRLLKTFTFGPVRNLVSEIATGPGKSAIERFIDSEMQSTNSDLNGSIGSPTSELLHRNALEATVRASALKLQRTGQFLRDTPAVSERDAAAVINGLFRNCNFFQKCPTAFQGSHILARRTQSAAMPDQNALSRRIETIFWASWCLTLRTQRTIRIPHRDEFGVYDRNGGTHAVPGYEYTDAGSAVLRRMQALGVRINGRGIHTYVGVVETDRDVEQTISWAQNHLRQSATQIM